MRATGIVGRARCDSGARPAVLGGCARGVSWQKVGSNGGWEMRDDEDDGESNRPGRAQDAVR